MDPYWQGEKPLTVWFLADGSYERRAGAVDMRKFSRSFRSTSCLARSRPVDCGHTAEGFEVSRGRWRFVQTVGTGQRQCTRNLPLRVIYGSALTDCLWLQAGRRVPSSG